MNNEKGQLIPEAEILARLEATLRVDLAETRDQMATLRGKVAQIEQTLQDIEGMR
jgi:uncharacterized membrane protein